MAEIIFQQTRINQGLAYFHRFLEVFENVDDLAAATEEQVLRLWQGLGYYSRARNLHRAAREIVEKHGGQLPEKYKDWLKIPGVGPYTAAAIASIAFNEVVPALDGNVYRLLARIFAIDASMEKKSGKKIFNLVASTLISKDNPSSFNQAMMDYGAMICKPVAPKCAECIFQHECLALKQNAIDKFPVKKTPKTVRPRFFNYFYFFYEDDDGLHRFPVRQRKGQDIWKNLYELPLIETQEEADINYLMEQPEWKIWFPRRFEGILTRQPKAFRHRLTHQLIHAKLFSFKLPREQISGLINEFFLTENEAFEKLPKSQLSFQFFQ